MVGGTRRPRRCQTWAGWRRWRAGSRWGSPGLCVCMCVCMCVCEHVCVRARRGVVWAHAPVARLAIVRPWQNSTC
eukprot:1149553-Pelagomonas_calceolata.AAC.7